MAETQERVLPEIVGKDFVNKFIENMPEEDYHKDRTAIHSGGINLLIKKSELHFHHHYVLGHKRGETKSTRFGKMCHMAVLEGGKFKEKYLIEPDFGDMRSSTNRAKRQEWINAQDPQAIILPKDEFDKLVSVVQSLTRNPIAMGVLKDGVPELTGVYRDRETDLKCIIRPDFVRKDTLVFIDFKTARDASKKGFARAIAEHGYTTQMAHYFDGIHEITGQKPEGAAWIVVESEPPYAVNVLTVTDVILDAGRIHRREAMHRIRQSIDSDRWPSYSNDRAEAADLPGWYLHEFEKMED